MSIKKLFDSTTTKNYAAGTSQKEKFGEIESAENAEQIASEQERFVPYVDYSDPQNFVTFGSARLYYESAMTRITDFYPYDGSNKEVNHFLNKSLDIEKYILKYKYPRTTGYATLARNGYAVSTVTNGYGVPTSAEYIDFKGGPGTGSATSLALKNLMPNPYSGKNNHSNIYDEDIYKTAKLPSDFGKGTRTSNLRANFDDGVTVEFWMKTGSIAETITKKQVIFDMWNNAGSSSTDYGRIRIELTGSGFTTDSLGQPFLITVESGSDSISQQQLGTASLHTTMGDWNHYAITMQNTGSSFAIELYVNGQFQTSASSDNHGYTTIGEINPKAAVGRIGALVTSPSGAHGPHAAAGAGRLSGSIDEFRYWKVKRTAKDIGRNWFTQIRGGANNDVSNADLGVYYKFNEGITGHTGTDSIVLDYAGRATNGAWTGYSSNARNTGSAIVSASAAASEYHDPIIRTNHPDVISLKSELIESGSSYDYNNNASMISMVPGWIQDQESENENSDLRYIAHIMGAYFDKLKLQIAEIPKLRQINYPSASFKPYPLAEHLPQSLGLYVPELFIDSTIIEKFLNRNEDTKFENSLSDTKNLIYQNLYNNLTQIYKSKGTEKAIRNVMRCFNVDDKVLSLQINSNNQEYELRNNLQQQLLNKNFINFNTVNNSKAIVYQRSASLPGLDNIDVSGSIQGNETQEAYGLTYEGNFLFPSYNNQRPAFVRDNNYDKVSLFGFVHVDTGTGGGGSVSNKEKGVATTTELQDDRATLKIYAVRDDTASKNVYFQLSSSFTTGSSNFSLTSSTLFDVYNNEQWNLSVRIKPKKYPYAPFVTGSGDSTYEIIFSGYNPQTAGHYDSFSLSHDVTGNIAKQIIRARKRPYVGADRTNLTGAVQYRSDVYASSVAFWTKYLNDDDLIQHAFDFENIGISASYRPISALDTGNRGSDIKNINTLALNWNFRNVTGSDSAGNFVVQDFSSGSLENRNSYGWVGKISGYQNTGYGYGFIASDTGVVDKKKINTYKFVDPEKVVSSDLVQTFSDEDVLFPNLRRSEIVPSYVYSLEKSLYNAISEEMLDFFAGAADFHTLIGRPVNRYRNRYKAMEKLRETFFRRVKEVATVEKYINYYKWFDDAITAVISQMVPASSEFVNNVGNIIESHVLERNKYQSKLNIIDSDQFWRDYEPVIPPVTSVSPHSPTPDLGLADSDGSADDGTTSVTSLDSAPESPRDINRSHNYWKKRAESKQSEISSGNSFVDDHRDIFKKIIYSQPAYSNSAGLPNLQTKDGVRYESSRYADRNYGSRTNLSMDFDQTRITRNQIKGGTNFKRLKSIDFTQVALRPAGPVNKGENIFTPTNVLIAFTSESVSQTNFINRSWPDEFIRTETKTFNVHHGRDWEDGVGYKNLKSSVALPFNIISSSVELSSGYNVQILDKVGRNLQITNLHHDAYGEQLEIPMQGPFTYNTVGGHQSRHIGLNDGTDNPETRAEAWRILLGTCDIVPHGAIGMVGPDYPPPDLKIDTALPYREPYPYDRHQKAYLYRDFIAKRPVNIKNISRQSGSTTVPGNYQNQYEIIHSFGATNNPRAFIENQPTLPPQLDNVRHTTNVMTFLERHRGSEEHFQFVDEYNTGYLTGAVNKSIIITRFAAPGGPEVESRGYQDFKASEFSPYNALTYRNLSVLKPTQGPSGSTSEPHGGTPTTSRVFDIHGKDYGLNSHTARRTGKFGRDSVFQGSPGASYDQLPGFHKTHRNRKYRIEISGTREISYNTNKDISNTYGLMFSGSSGVTAASAHLKHSGSFKNSAGGTWTAKTFTLSTWIYMQAGQSNTRAILTLGDAAATIGPAANRALLWGIGADEKPQFWIQTSVTNRCKWRSDAALATGSWFHLAVTYDGSSAANEPVFYLNAVSQSIDRYDGSMSSSMQSINEYGGDGNAYIGGINTAGSAYNPISKTALDDMAIYDEVFSAAEISTLYAGAGILNLTSTIAPNTGSLATWIRFGDVSGDPTNNDLMTQSAGVGPRFFDKMGRNNFDIRSSASDIKALLISSSLPNHPDVLPTASIMAVTTENVYLTRSVYDNLNIQHQIPRSDRQYMWISRSVVDVGNMRYAGYQNTTNSTRMAWTSSAGLTPYWVFVSSSDAYTGSSPNRFHQPTNRLNIIVLDPVDDDNGLMGNSDGTVEINEDLVGAARPVANPDYLNQLLNKRGAKYGWGWNALRQQDHQLILKQRKENELIIRKDATDTLTKYNLPPVSMKGRVALVNIDQVALDLTVPASKGLTKQNATFKVSNTNERIFFNQLDMNNIANIDVEQTYNPLKNVLQFANYTPGTKLNWVLYSQNIFPSMRNEFVSGTDRPNFDNMYWRDSIGERAALTVDPRGSAYTPTNNVAGANSFGIFVTQSAWCLDAMPSFLTRSGLEVAPITNMLTNSLPAGELQNSYFRWNRIPPFNQPGALYARMHTLDTPRSVAAPTGPRIAETGSLPGRSASFEYASAIKNWGAGEALWEAGDQAGRIEFIIGKTPEKRGAAVPKRFVSASSQPWWNNYESFKEDLKLKAKGFAVIPEFRISEQVDNYRKLGTDTSKFTGIPNFAVVGANSSSVQNAITDAHHRNFYKDYSNSDFLEGFLGIQKDSLLKAKEIRLTCTGAIRYNAYKGFYPAQRTLDLVTQFSKSFYSQLIISQSNASAGASFLYGKDSSLDEMGGTLKQIFDPVFSPGILYNSIKSGIAVDYPIIHDGTKIKLAHYGKTTADNNFALSITGAVGDATHEGSSKFKIGMSGGIGYAGGQFWDRRIPFEAIIRPKSFFPGYTFLNMEAHPSASVVQATTKGGQTLNAFEVTASLADGGDDLYHLMAKNFFGESATFFLDDSELTTLESNTVTNDLRFRPGEVYMSRIKLRRSHNGARTYQHEFDSFALTADGNDGDIGTGVVGIVMQNSGYGNYGCRTYVSSSRKDSSFAGSPAGNNVLLQSEFPLPQDPKMNPDFKETFTMYSRPSAFGPPVAGRPTGSHATRNITYQVGGNKLNGFYTSSFEKASFDSFEGYNPAFTPPYTNGEAWVDLIFRPSASISYDLERILAETETVCWRFDAGPKIRLSGSTAFTAKLPKPGIPMLIPVQQREGTNAGVINESESPNDDNTIPSPYDGLRINVNSMQITSSIDIFGVERVLEETSTGLVTNKSVGQKWLIRPKWETPMMNFNDEGIHPITAHASTLTLPTFASASVPRGMWHQFGVMPEDPNIGVFMEISEIPLQWLTNHYDVVNEPSVYNDFSVDNARSLPNKVKSLAKLCGFNKNNNTKRLGELKDKLTVKEAIVAVPYITKTINSKANSKLGTGGKKNKIKETLKQFISIPKRRWSAALKESQGTSVQSDSLSTSGESIRKLAQSLQNYVFPPQFDAINNPKIKPIAMYVFEFEYQFDKDDLSYMWQNIAPKDYKKLSFQTQTVTHNLGDNELINEKILSNENLRWMVFKVKQRATSDYYDLLVDQAGEATTQIKNTKKKKQKYEIGYNWPYDYLSFVELIKMDVDILFKSGK